MSYALLDVELGPLPTAEERHIQGRIKRSITMRQILSPTAPKSIGCRIEIQRLKPIQPGYVETVSVAKERNWFVEDGGFPTSEVILPGEEAPEGLEFTLLSSRCGYPDWESAYNTAKQLQQGFGFGYVDDEDERIVSGKLASFTYYLDPSLF